MDHAVSVDHHPGGPLCPLVVLAAESTTPSTESAAAKAATTEATATELGMPHRGNANNGCQEGNKTQGRHRT
jgi:hypothetical protein